MGVGIGNTSGLETGGQRGVDPGAPTSTSGGAAAAPAAAVFAGIGVERDNSPSHDNDVAAEDAPIRGSQRQAKVPAQPLGQEGVEFLAKVANDLSRTGNRRGKLSGAQIVVLKSWMADHFDHPYPSKAEQQRLASELSLTPKQVALWFQNARRRLWKPIASGGVPMTGTPHEMLFGTATFAKERVGKRMLRSPYVMVSVGVSRKHRKTATEAAPAQPAAAAGTTTVDVRNAKPEQ